MRKLTITISIVALMTGPALAQSIPGAPSLGQAIGAAKDAGAEIVAASDALSINGIDASSLPDFVDTDNTGVQCLHSLVQHFTKCCRFHILFRFFLLI